MTRTLTDISKTVFPGGVVLGLVHMSDLKTGMEVILLLLSIIYTAVRLGMLFPHQHLVTPPPIEEEDDLLD